jgi:hypothetical protein
MHEYDLVQVDLYRAVPIPVLLDYRGVFGKSVHGCRGRLVAMNVYDTSKSRIVDGHRATLKRVFPSVEVISRTDGNHIVFAFTRAKSVANPRRLEH